VDFLPFLVFEVLVAASIVAGVATWANARARRNQQRRGISMLLLPPTVGLLTVTAFCGRTLYRAYMLDEPMASAACRGDLAEVRSFLDRGASPNACTVDCVMSAKDCAAQGGHVDVVALLQERGAR
jgi:ankyrin repeat protein